MRLTSIHTEQWSPEILKILPIDKRSFCAKNKEATHLPLLINPGPSRQQLLVHRQPPSVDHQQLLIKRPLLTTTKRLWLIRG